MTLIEVMVALLVTAVGVLGAALLQLNALKYTDSAMRSLQVSFIAQDLIERIRANPQGHYALASLAQAPAWANLDNPRDQDLFDFASQLQRAVGDDAEASVVVNGQTVSIELQWNDSRAAQHDPRLQTMSLSAVVGAEPGVRP